MSPTRMSKIESAMRVVLKFHEAFNNQDVTGMVQLMSDDCIFENAEPAPDGDVFSGKEAIREYLEDFFRDSPQAHMEIEEAFGLGRRCVTRWRYQWVDEEGDKRHMRGADIFKVEDDLICKKLSYVKG